MLFRRENVCLRSFSNYLPHTAPELCLFQYSVSIKVNVK